MTVEELVEYLGDRRVHISATAPIELEFPAKVHESRREAFAMTGKPVGLWWAVGGEWIDWCSSEMPEWLKPYVYEVTPPERMLRITTPEEYDAVEISPYRYEMRLEDIWYYGWDCASGCTWNGGSVKLIAVRSEGGYELVNNGE